MDRLKRKFGFCLLASIFMLSSVFGLGMLLPNLNTTQTSSVVEEDESFDEGSSLDVGISADATVTGMNPTVSGANPNVQNAYFSNTVNLSGASGTVTFQNVIFEVGSGTALLSNYSNVSSVVFQDVYIVDI